MWTGNNWPAIWWLWGPPCRPGKTASLIFFSRSYITFSPFFSTFLTPVQQITQHCVHWHLSYTCTTDHTILCSLTPFLHLYNRSHNIVFTDTFLTPVQQITQHCVHWHLSYTCTTDHTTLCSLTPFQLQCNICQTLFTNILVSCVHRSHILFVFLFTNTFPSPVMNLTSVHQMMHRFLSPPTAFALVKCIMYLACKVAFRYKVSSVAHVTWTLSLLLQ